MSGVVVTSGDATQVDVQLVKRSAHEDISLMVDTFANSTHRTPLLGLIEPTGM